MFDFTNKVVIVTGGNSGIGRCAAEMYAKAGAKVALVARRADKLEETKAAIEAAGGVALSIPGDVTKPETAVNVCKQVFDTWGKIDILVNSAGAGDFTRPITGVTDEFWNSIIAVNQNGVFYFCREVVKYMQPVNSGVIINISSVGGVFHNSGFAYAAAKSAVIGMTRNMAIQFAGTGIRINAVCPGGTDTPMIELMSNPAMQLPCDKEMGRKTAQHFNYKLPNCSAEDQANAILFLSSDEAKAINGQYLVVDHGAWV